MSKCCCIRIKRQRVKCVQEVSSHVTPRLQLQNILVRKKLLITIYKMTKVGNGMDLSQSLWMIE